MITRRNVLAVAGLGVAGPVRADELDTVRHLQYATVDFQTTYIQQLLALALARSGRAYVLQPVSMELVQNRALIELTGPKPPIDVFWSMTDKDRERRPLTVRIPIDRGLFGWRIALVRRSQAQRWQRLQSLPELARYDAVQMPDWPDTAILRANGLPVQTTTYYAALFEMLVRGHVDYFPRSIMEIGDEFNAHHDLDIAIERHVLLHYPAAMYFFVSPSRPRLAADLEIGLEAMVADGELQRLFRAQFGDLLGRYELGRRVTLELKNPLLPVQTPLQRKELWWSPQEA